MASILKVDTLQKPDGSTPTAADLGLDVAGSVVQVQRYSDATALYTTATSPTNTSLQASFTPKYSTSKLLIVLTGNMSQYTSGTNGSRGYLDMALNGTRLEGFGSAFGTREETANQSQDNVTGTLVINYLVDADSTSNRTYIARFWSGNSGVQIGFNIPTWGGTNPAIRSTITIYEIAQ